MPDPTACRWCGAIHGPLCPHVKALEFDADNPDVVVRVEFVGPPERLSAAVEADYPKLGPSSARNVKE